MNTEHAVDVTNRQETPSTLPFYASSEYTKILAKMLKIQGLQLKVVTNAEGQDGHRKFQYAPLDTIMEVLQPYLTREKIVVSHQSDATGGVTTRAFDVESGEWLGSYHRAPSVAKDIKKSGGHQTYGARYNVKGLFNITPVGEDNAGENNPPPEQKQERVMDIETFRKNFQHVAQGYVNQGKDKTEVVDLILRSTSDYDYVSHHTAFHINNMRKQRAKS